MAARSSERPPTSVCNAFGVSGREMRPLVGGGETSVLIDGVVLKQVLDPGLTEWSQGLLSAAALPTGLRWPRPVPTVEGAWVFEGWSGTEFIEDLRSLRANPDRVISAGEAFSDAVTRGGSDLMAVRERTDRWAVADRHAWGDGPVSLTAEAQQLSDLLRSSFVQTEEADVVVHGDLTGNVFEDASGVAVVLDFTPYARPRRFGAAVVVADNLLWYGARIELAESLGDSDGLARALLFRMVAEQLATDPRHGADLADYWRVLDLLGWT